VEKVAQQAGRAAPAVAIAGALVAVPSAQALASTATPAAATAAGHQAAAGTTAHPGTATLDAVEARAVTVASTSTARHAAKATYYQVRSGDSLSTIAERFYHNSGDWQYLYHENDKAISNPNLIYVGMRLFIPATAPAPAHYVPRHAKPAAHAVTASRVKSSKPATRGGSAEGGTKIVQTAALTSYSCSALENLWDQAGGSPSHALMAAEIARAESSGNPNAVSPTDDFGLWQINASNGALATLNPYSNARSAITLSDNGATWNAWTTYHSGAYYGQC
jgi:LysM repeat protein